jgi:hypothetical protein
VRCCCCCKDFFSPSRSADAKKNRSHNSKSSDRSFSLHTTHNMHTRFCKLKGHEMFCEVERSYIEDGFNLYGLRACVSNFSDCLDLILDRFGPDDDSDDSQLTQSACSLYGLIHARYILTAHGLDAMYAKVRHYSIGVLFAVRIYGRSVVANPSLYHPSSF